jgi:hypothetical protein
MSEKDDYKFLSENVIGLGNDLLKLDDTLRDMLVNVVKQFNEQIERIDGELKKLRSEIEYKQIENDYDKDRVVKVANG